MVVSRFRQALILGSVNPDWDSTLHFGKSDPPPPPDYAAAAKAQGAANVDTARVQGRMNNPNIFTPLGSQTVTWGGNSEPVFDESAYNAALDAWRRSGEQQILGVDRNDLPIYGSGSPTGPMPDRQSFYTQSSGGDQPTITQSLTPAGQSRFDTEQRIVGNLGNIAESGLDRVQGAMSSGFDPSLPDLRSGVSSQQLRTSYDAGPQLRTAYDSAGGPQRALDYAGAPRLPGIDDFSADRQRVEEAIYSRLNPQLDRDRETLRTQLINTGFRPGTEGYNEAMSRADRQANDARMQAILSGGNEQSRLFGLGLQARQQSVGEVNNQGAFANSAQEQANRQNREAALFANAAQAQANRQNQEAAQFANAAGQGQFAMDMSGATFGNQARQNALAEALMRRQLPLNELNALRSGSQVQIPQFPGYQGSQIQPPPLFNATMAGHNAAMGAYNADQASGDNFMKGLFGLGGAALGAPLNAASGKPWWAMW